MENSKRIKIFAPIPPESTFSVPNVITVIRFVGSLVFFMLAVVKMVGEDGADVGSSSGVEAPGSEQVQYGSDYFGRSRPRKAQPPVSGCERAAGRSTVQRLDGPESPHLGAPILGV